MRRAIHVLLRKTVNLLVSAALVCSLVPAPGIAYAVEAGEGELALEAVEDSAAMPQDQEQSEQGLQESAQQESVLQGLASETAEQDELLPDAAEDENLAAASASSLQDDDANHETRAQQRREAMLERQRLAQERREQLRAQYAQYEGVTADFEEEHAGKSVHDANESETLVAQATLPRSYDAREHGYVTPVRNQNPLGTCWAFAMTAALESTMLKRGMASLGSLDLSERHAAYFSFHAAVDALKGLAGDSTTAVGSEYGSNDYQKSMSDPYLICGNTASSAARSTSTWAGPVNENVAPYQALVDRYYDDVDNDVTNAASFLRVTNLSDTLARNSANNRALLDEYRFVLMKDRDDVKQAIIDYGGGSLAFAWDSDYMNYGTASYCSEGKTNSSHIVEFIGWDDDYPRANFGFTYFHDDGNWGYTDVPDTSSTTPLELNKKKEVALKVGEKNEVWFTFVPPADGCYQFYGDSYGRHDWPEPYVYRVASANDQLIEGYFSNDFYDADAFSGEALLRAGVTYYVSVCIDRPDAEEGDSCPFTMTVTQVDDAADDCPAHDGAWLCKNSWGSGWASNDGYFWISYEDCILARDDWDAAFYGAVPTSKYNNNYQYDGTTSWNTDTVSSGGSISNVFTAKAYPGGGEQLKAVTLSLDDVNVDYAVQVYLNLTDPNNPTSGTPYLAQPVTGKTHYAGYYTIDLPNPVPLREGTDFSVVITLSHEDGSNVTYMADASSSTSYSRSVNAVTKQQSFVKATASGGWKDLATVRLADTDAPGVSARIKAFTTNVSASSMPVPRIDHAAVTLGAASFAYTGSAVTPAVTVRYGEDILAEGTDYTVSYQQNVEVGTAQVTARGRGSYTGSKSVTFAIKKAPVITATNKSVVATKTVNLGARVTAGAGKISYASSDTRVATVTASGVVTGVSAGKATITISCAENDQYLGASKKVTVTVSKAANTLAAKAKKKKVSVKAKKIAKKKLVLASNVKVSNAKGAVTYANVSTKKAAKKLKVNAKTGKITVPKRFKKGTYIVKVRVTAKGTSAYAAATKSVMLKVVLK